MRTALARAAAGGFAMLMLAGCGLKKPPKPYASEAPVPVAFQVRQFGEEVLVSWKLPVQAQAEARGGLRAQLLWLDELVPGCASCPPLNEMSYEFETTGPPLSVEQDTVYYRFRPERRESGWRARTAFKFGVGEGHATGIRSVPGLSAIPRPALRWEWSVRPEQTAPEGTPRVRLSWEPVQERVVHVVEAGTPPGERVLYYRANVYARSPEAPWRLSPVNPAPVAAATWVGGPSSGELEGGQGLFEYAIRWVNDQGGEGPLSEPARIDFAPERTR